MEPQGAAITASSGGQLVVVRNPWRPQVTVTAMSADMRSVVTLVLTHEERDRVVAALTGRSAEVS